jgi:hypothetical protein
MTEFHLIEPTLENYYRGIILFGANVATYKFALGKSLIELASNSDDLIPIEELADHFSTHIAEHVALTPKQSTRNVKVRYFDLCEKYSKGKATKDELVAFTVKNAFNDVIDRFHIINGEEVDKRFYIDERKTSKGIRLTNELRQLVLEHGGSDLPPEIEARWRLVETAWELQLSKNLIAVDHESASGNLVVNRNNRRTNVTSSRDALNGYQKGKCFFCFDKISVQSGSPDLAHVDHFFPHILKPEIGHLVDGIWNLVLSCSDCNGSGEKGAKVPVRSLIERLNRRNEYLIDSNHPLRETIILQTGKSPEARISFINDIRQTAENRFLPEWEPPNKGNPVF